MSRFLPLHILAWGAFYEQIRRGVSRALIGLGVGPSKPFILLFIPERMGLERSCARHKSVHNGMSRKKANVDFCGPGYGSSGYVYFDEDELEIFRTDEPFRISLVEKYYPNFRGRVTNAYISSIEDA